MKREREEKEEEEMASMAKALVLFSEGEGTRGRRHHGRLFGCKTCNRQFASFQALGGHRASHKKPKLPGEKIILKGKSKTHECPICKFEFSMGQALGGHMRRHRVAAENFGRLCEEKKFDESICLDLDLNTFPMEKEKDLGFQPLNLGLGLGLALVHF